MTHNPGCGVPRLPWLRIVQSGAFGWPSGVIRVFRAVLQVNLSVTHCFCLGDPSGPSEPPFFGYSFIYASLRPLFSGGMFSPNGFLSRFAFLLGSLGSLGSGLCKALKCKGFV